MELTPFERHFCENVRNIRMRNGITQKDMAAILGITPTTLRRMENYTPGMRIGRNTLLRFCRAFGLGIDDVTTKTL